MNLAETMNVLRDSFSLLGALQARPTGFGSQLARPVVWSALWLSSLACHPVRADDFATQLPSQIRVIELQPSRAPTTVPPAVDKPLVAIDCVRATRG